MVDVGVEIDKTNELIEIVGKESTEAAREGAIAAEQEAETNKLSDAAKAEK
jgi:hypothetical protein